MQERSNEGLSGSVNGAGSTERDQRKAGQQHRRKEISGCQTNDLQWCVQVEPRTLSVEARVPPEAMAGRRTSYSMPISEHH